ncbi:MAG: DUF3883 domain-containing protein [Planctomycetaceae bacterium]|nr:DUF3883 domain-containing protein [Planctomycetaceae bacterium]
MTRLEDITKGTLLRGILTTGCVTVVDVTWHGSDVAEVTYKTQDGQTETELLFRDRESSLEVESEGRPWNYTADGHILRMVSEAHRIRLAYLFDPMLAVHTSVVEPLPHQITAVYEEMLPRQPLRFLLADDPGAGKTIMAGLLIKELRSRGDLQSCMIVAPGNLVEQWQDELSEKFKLNFEILTNEKLQSSRTGNWFQENPLCICRLDKLSRDEGIQEKLSITDWDLVVVDESHKMSASFFSGEVKETKRYKLGRLLSRLTRHFLLMTATPHNGKEEDFQLFMALLDGDRFEGRFRDGVHVADTSDLMRRMVKEQLVRFDETPLFPERIAYTASYELSDEEARLYKEVTDYVREEFNRADALQNDGRRGTVGFALTILQRRLASSPEAIYQSLRRRRERLEKRRREEQLLKRGAEVRIDFDDTIPIFEDDDDIDDFEDRPSLEVENDEEQIADLATAAQTIAELEVEIEMLRKLEAIAQQVRRSGADRKWDELSSLLQDEEHMFDCHGHRRKLVIFTEHRDTLTYLTDRIRTLLGSNEAVVTIKGGMGREERRKAQELFTQDKDTMILVATDAAGEGINLQRAHLMINYDLPWNPNRLEQRFGRIHRIGQTEVCYLWNLVAAKTREGDVFQRLLEKLEVERESLGGAVFDVLGQAIEGRELRQLLVEAVRYNDDPATRARLFQKVETALDHDRIQGLIEDRALAHDSMDASRIRAIREEMDRAHARRLQPHFISTFFRQAFEHLGGQVREREPGRFEIPRVPAPVRSRDRVIGNREIVLAKYERITFEKDKIHVPGKPQAAFICPGHPLLDSVIDLILERHRDVMRQGAVLIDPTDEGGTARALFYLEHSIQDARRNTDGNRRVISRQLQFVTIDNEGAIATAGYAPYLDLRAAEPDELKLLQPVVDDGWLNRGLESQAMSFAVSQLVPNHFQEVRHLREERIDKTRDAVKQRLTKEIAYWDHRAQEIKLREEAGKTPKLNSARAQQRANDLEGRLQKRLEDLEQERKLSPLPPVVVGGALIVPIGLLRKLRGESQVPPDQKARETKRIEMLAMEAVTKAEVMLGNEPRDVSINNCGYDIESNDGTSRRLRFIEVKGRAAGADTVTVTRNEVVTGINSDSQYILAIVEVDGNHVSQPVYVRHPFQKEPDFGAVSINYKIDEMLMRGGPPS